MSKHTPIPWETNYTGNIWGDIDNPEHDGDFPLLARVELWEASPHDEEAKANAVFICKAVNCHDELIEACQDLIVVLRTQAQLAVNFGGSIALHDGNGIAWDKAKAIIAKAEDNQ